MDNDFRRMLVAIAAAMAVFFAYRLIMAKFFPLPPPAVTAEGPAAPPESGLPSTGPGVTATAPASAAASVPTTARMLSLVSGQDTARVTLGGRPEDVLRMELDPRGASVATLELFQRNAKGQFVYRMKPQGDGPYVLLAPIDDGRQIHDSFTTYRLWIKEFGSQSWPLDTLAWAVAEQAADRVVFTTALATADTGQTLLRLTKTYRLLPGKPVFDFELAVDNVGPDPLTIWVDQDGPLGVPLEGQQYDNRQLLAAQQNKGTVELDRAQQHQKLLQATRRGETVPLLVPDKGPFVWTALMNKYFAVFTRPVPTSGTVQNYVAGVAGLVADAGATQDSGDLLARMTTAPALLPPGDSARYPFEVYTGPKDAATLARVNPDSCTFGWLQDLMVWLLESIHIFVRNYGVAIMILVLIVRGLLHPLSVWQQKSMFRMQEAMARLQPKLAELKEKYANDKVKQNQETMRLFGEEGVNPAGNFVSFIPLMIQMPILVALWTALNTDVNLRHAPFDGWWITDLSAPDALIAFSTPQTVPILGDIPLIGGVFKNVVSINLLPILMGISMWLQQKYMPKPAMQAKIEAAKKQAQQGKPKSGPSPEDQLRQQMIMSYVMAILFPLMFYKMPSGLNLYWMSTNVFGICESLIIRKQIDEEKKRRALEGPRPPKKTGVVARLFKHIASQAEEIQRKADELGKADESKRKDKPDQKKKP